MRTKRITCFLFTFTGLMIVKAGGTCSYTDFAFSEDVTVCFQRFLDY